MACSTRSPNRSDRAFSLSGESAFIDSLRALASHPAARGLEDDAAVLEIGEETLILTHDTMVESVHFLPDQDLSDVAWKLVASNLSDLAAKGAEPVGILLSHMLGDNDDRFVAGLTEALDQFSVPLLGGDTVSAAISGARSFGLTAIGRATHTPVPSRSDAQPGDNVYITGPVGAAMIGFERLRDGLDGDSLAYRRPNPLLDEGKLLVPHVSAIMDISDGLLLDASRIANASKVTINVDTASVPIAAPEDRRQDALRWGDDYQLLFTAPRATKLPIKAHRIGSVIKRGDSSLLLDHSAPAVEDTLGYTH